MLLATLTKAFPEPALKSIPRTYAKLFEETRLRTTMALYLMELEVAQSELKKADADSAISDTTMGYICLRGSGLSETEQYHVIGLAGSTLKLSGLKAHLLDLYARGSHRRAERRPQTTGRGYRFERRNRFAGVAEDCVEEDDYGDEDDLWGAVAEEIETEQAEQASDDYFEYATSELEAELAGDPEMAEAMDSLAAEATAADEAYVSFTESKQRVQQMARQRGFFRGTLDGFFTPGRGGGRPPTGGRGTYGRGRDAKGGKGKKGRGRYGKGKNSKGAPTPRCTYCNRFGHSAGDDQCPARTAGGDASAEADRKRKGRFQQGPPRDRAFVKRVAAMFVTFMMMIRVITGKATHSEDARRGFGMFGDGQFESEAYVQECGEDLTNILVAEGWGNLLAVHDTGCTDSVMTTSWRADAQAELRKFGLEMVPAPLTNIKFRGLGGVIVDTVATWRVPVDIHEVHAEMIISEIPGEMPTLVSRAELERWGVNLYLADGKIDYASFGLFNLEARRAKTGHIAEDIFAFGPDVQEDPVFSDFRIQVPDATAWNAQAQGEARDHDEVTEIYVQNRADQEHMKDKMGAKKHGTIPGKVRKQGEKQVSELQRIMSALRDHGRTLVWDIFAGEGVTTEIAIQGGHQAGDKADIRYGVDLSKPEAQQAVLHMIRVYEPWLVTIYFPCARHSPLQNINEAHHRTKEQEA